MSDCKAPCAGCAFGPGAAANKEMYNHLRGLICLLGPVPFVCHDGQDWKNPENHKLAPAQFFRTGWKICEGWRREVARLAATGYYEHTSISRGCAQAALNEIEILVSKEIDEEDRAEAIQTLAQLAAWLFKKHQKFTGEDLGEKVNALVESGYFREEKNKNESVERSQPKA
jgi:hypothetical protein